MATIPNDAELLERAKLIANARFSDVYFSILWTQERYGVIDRVRAEKEALERLGVKSKEELTSIILEQLRDPDSELNNPELLDLSKGGGMIRLESQPVQPVTEGGLSPLLFFCKSI
ncbi:hypothetical protein ACFL3G_02185 [Planctomycetota bacterium]